MNGTGNFGKFEDIRIAFTGIYSMSGLCVCAVNDACLDGVIHNGVSGILTEDDDESLLAGLIRAFSDEGRRIAQRASEYAQPYGTEAFAAAEGGLYGLLLERVVAKCYKENTASYHMLSSCMRKTGEDDTFFYFEKLV